MVLQEKINNSSNVWPAMLTRLVFFSISADFMQMEFIFKNVFFNNAFSLELWCQEMVFRRDKVMRGSSQ